MEINGDKSQIIRLGRCQQLDKITVQTMSQPNATVSTFSTIVNDHRRFTGQTSIGDKWVKNGNGTIDV